MLEFIKFAVGEKKKKETKNKPEFWMPATKRSSGNTTSRNEVINHILC